MSLKHVSGWLNVTGAGFDGPADPDYGHPVGPGWSPVDPGWGTRPPVDPGYGRPDWGGGRPDNDLPSGGHIWGTLIRWLSRPQVGGGPIKPPGLWPVLPGPIDPGWGVPGGPPSGPGDWVPVDPGWGKPPLWGFIHIDNGLPSGPPSHIDNTLPGQGGRPDNSLPGQGGRPDNTLPGQGHGGAWYPLDPGFGKPIRPCPPGGKPHPPIWAWIPDRPPVEGSLPGGTATVSPTSGTVLASGGTVTTTVYPSTSTPEWSVSALPDWVTASPMSGSGSAMVTLTAAANTTGLPKQAMVKIGGATFTLNQGAV